MRFRNHGESFISDPFLSPEQDANLLVELLPQTNQLGIRTHLWQPPYSVVTDSRAHVHMLEAGGIASHSMASVNSVFAANGHHMTVEEVLDNCTLGDDIHTAPTKLVCVENTLSGSELAPFPSPAHTRRIACTC